MNRSEAERILLEGVERSLSNQNPAKCFSVLPPEDQVDFLGKIGSTLEMLSHPDSPISLEPHQAPPPLQPGGVEAVYVDDGGSAPVLPFATVLVLGLPEGPQQTLPNGHGIVQPYTNGTVLINGAGDPPFVLPAANANAMAPTGRNGLAVRDAEGVLRPVPVTDSIEIEPGTRIALFTLPPA